MALIPDQINDGICSLCESRDLGDPAQLYFLHELEGELMFRAVRLPVEVWAAGRGEAVLCAMAHSFRPGRGTPLPEITSLVPSGFYGVAFASDSWMVLDAAAAADVDAGARVSEQPVSEQVKAVWGADKAGGRHLAVLPGQRERGLRFQYNGTGAVQSALQAQVMECLSVMAVGINGAATPEN